MNIRIREAGIDDSLDLAHVQVDSYRAAYASILPAGYLAHFTYEEQTQDWRDLLSADPHDLLLVAETGSGEIAGYALGHLQTDLPDYACELAALHIRQAHQPQGVGQQLVQAVAESYCQQGCSSLMLWVLAKNPARFFYERLGGQLIGEKHYEIDGVDVIEVAYGWPDIASLCAQ